MNTYTENNWECAICLQNEIRAIGLQSRQQLKSCKHSFHLGCIQNHFIIKNKIQESPSECVLECPLCRSKTTKSNWGVRVSIDKVNNQIILKKGVKSLNLKLSLYGKDVFTRDIKIAKQMIQNIVDMCFDVETYWMVAQQMPLESMNKQYADNDKKCAKLIQLPTEESDNIYIERSFGI